MRVQLIGPVRTSSLPNASGAPCVPHVLGGEPVLRGLLHTVRSGALAMLRNSPPSVTLFEDNDAALFENAL